MSNKILLTLMICVVCVPAFEMSGMESTGSERQSTTNSPFIMPSNQGGSTDENIPNLSNNRYDNRQIKFIGIFNQHEENLSYTQRLIEAMKRGPLEGISGGIAQLVATPIIIGGVKMYHLVFPNREELILTEKQLLELQTQLLPMQFTILEKHKHLIEKVSDENLRNEMKKNAEQVNRILLQIQTYEKQNNLDTMKHGNTLVKINMQFELCKKMLNDLQTTTDPEKQEWLQNNLNEQMKLQSQMIKSLVVQERKQYVSPTTLVASVSAATGSAITLGLVYAIKGFAGSTAAA